jgi:hypothetical protein
MDNMIFYKDPTEEHEYDLSNEDIFWNSQDQQTEDAKIYVKELEVKISKAKKGLMLLKDLSLQLNHKYYSDTINTIILNLQ